MMLTYFSISINKQMASMMKTILGINLTTTMTKIGRSGFFVTAFRGACKTNFRSKLGFCPNRLDQLPPPPRLPERLGFPKRKNKINVYFAV